MNFRVSVFLPAIVLAVSFLRADTSAFTIVDDASLNTTLAAARSAFMANKAFTRLNAAILIPQPNGTWKRGTYNGNTTDYPASCCKLGYLAAAMYWCRTNGHAYNYLNADVGPMITVSDNVACGRVVDDITLAPNIANLTSTADSRWAAWYAKRQYTENFLASRGLLENQVLLNKTYPTNSGSTPVGAESVCVNSISGNLMQPRLSASLMLEIVKGAIEPAATSYMTGLLTHDKWGDDSVFGFGLPPGTIYFNKLGVAYDTVEDIAYIKLPNNKECILAAFSNSYAAPYSNDPAPYDASALGGFAEAVIEQFGLDAGDPPKVKIASTSAAFSAVGPWSTGTSSTDKFDTSYRFKSGGTGAGKAIWNLNVPQTGKYEVCVWYPQGTNRATDAPYTVTSNSGSSTIRVNQQQVGGRWFRLGDYNFNVGTGTVALGDNITDSTKAVIADAIKITMWPAAASTIDNWPNFEDQSGSGIPAWQAR